MEFGVLKTLPYYRGTLSYDTLRSRVIDLVAEKGEDYVGHPGAYFRPDGRPGCLLGELAAQDGATRSKLVKDLTNAAGVHALNASGYLVPTDTRTYAALTILQRFNDEGRTWFDAACHTFGLTPVGLREEIARRLTPKAEIDAEAYVEWVGKFSVGETKTTHSYKLPVHTPVAEHVLAA